MPRRGQRCGFQPRRIGLGVFVAALLRFEDEKALLVKVDEFGRRMAEAIVEHHRVLEDVAVLRGIGLRRLRPRDADHVAEFAQEELVIGPLGMPEASQRAMKSATGGLLVWLSVISAAD